MKPRDDFQALFPLVRHIIEARLRQRFALRGLEAYLYKDGKRYESGEIQDEILNAIGVAYALFCKHYNSPQYDNAQELAESCARYATRRKFATLGSERTQGYTDAMDARRNPDYLPTSCVHGSDDERDALRGGWNRAHQPDDSTGKPDTTLQDVETRDLIETLPPNLQAYATLTLQGCTNREIAQRLGVSPQTVGRRNAELAVQVAFRGGYDR